MACLQGPTISDGAVLEGPVSGVRVTICCNGRSNGVSISNIGTGVMGEVMV